MIEAGWARTGPNPRQIEIRRLSEDRAVAAGAVSAALSGLAIMLDGIWSLFAIGVALVLLGWGAHLRPARAFAAWGALFVPLSGFFALPGLSSGTEIGLALAAWGLLGAALHGGIALVIAGFVHRMPSQAGVLGLAAVIPLAELAARTAGLVLHPIGLFGTSGSWAWLIAWGGVPLAGFALCWTTFAVSRLTFERATLPSLIFLIACLGGGPEAPEAPAIEIFGVSHQPDSETKWTEAGAAEALERLKVLSEDRPDGALLVWPENAVTGTFDLQDVLASVSDVEAPLLFGMTRQATPESSLLLNSAVLVTDHGVQLSDKQRLVPIMETGLPMLGGSVLAAGNQAVFELGNGVRLLPLLCYDLAFPLPDDVLVQDIDAVVVLFSESGLVLELAQKASERHRRARELEIAVPVVLVSDI